MAERDYGQTTKGQYITAHPKTLLTENLSANAWPDDTGIMIVCGWDNTEKTHHLSNGSKLYHALQLSTTGEHVRGGKISKQGGRSTFMFAVMI